MNNSKRFVPGGSTKCGPVWECVPGTLYQLATMDGLKWLTRARGAFLTPLRSSSTSRWIDLGTLSSQEATSCAILPGTISAESRCHDLVGESRLEGA